MTSKYLWGIYCLFLHDRTDFIFSYKIGHIQEQICTKNDKVTKRFRVYRNQEFRNLCDTTNVSNLVPYRRKWLIWHAAEMKELNRRRNFDVKVFYKRRSWKR